MAAVIARWRASARVRALVRAAIGAAILIAVVSVVGAEPFLAGLAAVDLPAIAAAVGLGVAATLATTWRWRVLAGRLGLRLGWGQAISAYYRSQFLNSVLPGGVVGDVHRAVWHGGIDGAMAPAARAVVAERGAGQVVQLLLAAVVLVSLQPWAYAPAVGIALLALVVLGGALAVVVASSARVREIVARELGQLRVAFGSPATVVRVTLASAVAIACLVAIFLIACLAVGVDAPLERLGAVALIAVLAGVLPFSVGGWGPREGAVAWAFAVVGLGAASGVAVSTAFGVLALFAVAPGAVVVAASVLRRRAVAAQHGEDPSPR